jgi:hypothetical protein
LSGLFRRIFAVLSTYERQGAPQEVMTSATSSPEDQALDAVLLRMHESAQTESRSAQQTMQAVVYWGVAGAGAVAVFAASFAAVEEGSWLWLAYLVASVGWPLLAVIVGFYWLNEFARMLRAGLIGRRIECEILARHPTLDAHLLFEHALDIGVSSPSAPGRKDLRLRAGYAVGAGVMMLAVLGGQGVVYLYWGTGSRPDVPCWVIVVQLALLVAQIIAFLVMGCRVLKRFRPSCSTDCQCLKTQ